MMTLDNGATDGQSNSHPVAFRCVERFEELVRGSRVETHPRILHDHSDTIAFVSFGFDQQLSPTIVDSAHRVRGVPEKVQDDLLKLYPIAGDNR